MKKILAITLMAVMAVTLFAGCSDPVYDDLQNFINVEMAEVNANYTKLTTEVGTWSEAADDSDIAKSINEVLLPIVEESLTKLEAITPATEEVSEIKAMYVKVMDTYKVAFEALAEGCVTQDTATIDAGNENLGKAVDYLNEYNAALESLAEEFGAEVEY